MYWGFRNWQIDFSQKWEIYLILFDPTNNNELEKLINKDKTRIVCIEAPYIQPGISLISQNPQKLPTNLQQKTGGRFYGCNTCFDMPHGL